MVRTNGGLHSDSSFRHHENHPSRDGFFALRRAQKHAENADLKLNKNFKNCDKIDYINM